MSEKVMITFEDKVPDSVVQDAMQQIKDSGGTITQDFTPLIKGFAATLNPESLDSFKSVCGDQIKTIEQDGIVTTMSKQSTDTSNGK